MTEYRDDLKAARMRIETLEAKLAERDAALRAREAEIAERDAAFAAMQKRPGSPAPSRGRVWILVLSHVLVSAAAVGAGVALSRSGAAPTPTQAEGPMVEGRVPPSAPLLPMATAGGQAQGSGDADLSTALKGALEDVRPKVKLCYADERKAHPEAEGFLKAVFEVGKDGRIGHVRLAPMTRFNDPWWSKDMGACVTRVLEAVKVPLESRGSTVAETSWFLTPTF